jgi:hypothetical protein
MMFPALTMSHLADTAGGVIFFPLFSRGKKSWLDDSKGGELLEVSVQNVNPKLTSDKR